MLIATRSGKEKIETFILVRSAEVQITQRDTTYLITHLVARRIRIISSLSAMNATLKYIKV